MKFWEFKAAADGGEAAELMIYGDIGSYEGWNDVVAKQFVNELKTITAKKITVNINSVGGEVFAGLAIYNSLKAHNAEITVKVDGLAASIASIVAMAGDTVIMPESSMMMIHNPWTIAAGNSNDFRKMADDLDKMRDSLVTIYKSKTGLDEAKIIELLNDETWLTANEAKDLGFADTVETGIKAAASLTKDTLAFNGRSFKMEHIPNAATLIAKINDIITPPKEETPPKAEASAVVSQNQSKKEEVKMNFDEVKAKFSSELEAFAKAKADEAYAKGVDAERARIKAIDDLNVKGYDKLVAEAKYGANPLNAGDLALNVLAAQNQANAKMLKNMAEDAEGVEAPEQSAEGEQPKNDDEAAQNKFSVLFAKAAEKIKR